MKEKIIKDMDRQWDGFAQILRTPPKPGEPIIKFRDYDGVNGTEVAWSEETQRWQFTGMELQNIPPIEGSITVRKNLYGENFVWSPEKTRWIKDIEVTYGVSAEGNLTSCIRFNNRNELGEIIPLEE